jgi:hypothetical protein
MFGITYLKECKYSTSGKNGDLQGQIKNLRGPRPVFSVVPQSTEKCGVWVCVRCFIIYVMRYAFVNHIYSFYHRSRLKLYKYVGK